MKLRHFRTTGGYGRHYSEADTLVKRRKLVKLCRRFLIKELQLDFDTFVVTGRSGMFMGLPLSHSMGKGCLVVARKSDLRDSHAASPIHGDYGKRFLFLDDFATTGATRDRVIEIIEGNLGGFTWVGSLYYSAHWPESCGQTPEGTLPSTARGPSYDTYPSYSMKGAAK